MRIGAFHVASFLSAFLLFQIQPMIAKAMLPGFGGSYLVWGTCMAFFQGLLILGYGWVHKAQRLLGPGYAPWHWLVLLPPLLFLPFDFGKVAAPSADAPLFAEVMRLLALAAGVPYFALSTSSPLLQSWLASSTLPQRGNPYVLYSASNVGSILALLTYPFAIEPALDLSAQATVWAALYVVLLVAFAFCMPWTSSAPASRREAPASAVGARRFLRWLLPSAAGSIALVAVGNVLTFDVASVPFLWVLPLSAYLLTFVLLFKRTPWNPKSIDALFYWFAMTGMVVFMLSQFRWTLPIAAAVAIQIAVLFVVCMKCHGVLARMKPEDPRDLTAYYFAMSIGGFAGTLFVTGLLPLLSRSIVEYPLALVVACAACAWAEGSFAAENADGRLKRRLVAIAVCIPLAMVTLPFALRGVLGEGRALAALIVVSVGLVVASRKGRPLQMALALALVAACLPTSESLVVRGTMVLRLRNYYGIYKVYDRDGIRWLQHGTTLHGRQSLDPAKAATPMSYYHPTAPPGQLLKRHAGRFHNVGMIGLGTGAIATYFGEGDSFRVFELDADNLPIAREQFTYLDLAERRGVELDFVFGDGRVNLKGVPDGSYDLFIVDAFSSGSIPIHLLTSEAVAEYLRVLKPDGVLLMHVSNRVLDLVPQVHAIAAGLGVPSRSSTNAGAVHPDADETTWMVVVRDAGADAVLGATGWRATGATPEELPRPWTDRWSNLPAAMF